RTITSVLKKDLDKKTHYPEGYWGPHAILTHAIEELGEVAREIHRPRGPTTQNRLHGKNQVCYRLKLICGIIKAWRYFLFHPKKNPCF
ncbi:MAG: hypothetical protein AAB862_01995, partial [Patescibacteria group bacterium]